MQFTHWTPFYPLDEVVRIKVLNCIVVGDEEESLGNEIKNVPEASDPSACRIHSLELITYLLDCRIITRRVVKYNIADLVVCDQLKLIQHV